ncbi:MAG: molecular chaperone DnaJ [SAR86 cluster bacterium]|uniref:Molecular chaperone DnaJ n=1 Tax=SAR86 cluster bacterium TaxID=2030880 RepID=A0A2A5B249_9GAMM|nr:MAG: molecular chaperone DnaJ [SAR86 cluster bacterium]
MIFRLLLLIMLPVMAYFFVRSIAQRYSLTPRQNRMLFFFVATLLVIGVLIAIGRLPVQFIFAPIGVAATFLLRMLPTLLRLLPMWQMFKNKTNSAKPKTAGQVSTIRTEFLEMELQHSDGGMDGVVLKGTFAKQRLSALGLAELKTLYGECSIDADSRQVFAAYMDNAHADWVEQMGQTDTNVESLSESIMTRELALEILGINESSGREEITKAHRSLMQKLHPDRGGSDYLAKKINMAKDFLMNDL